MATTGDRVTPSIALPKGGGALSGMGETFQHDPFTGSASWTVPIPVTAGRGGFGPELALHYTTGGGNGPFGLGWELSLPRISRKTELGLPRYDDRDRFLMSGAEELVPLVRRGASSPERLQRGAFTIERFRPRIEGLFVRIERWTDASGPDVHWRATTHDNVTSVYGRTPLARVLDPADPAHVFSWLLEETFDARGNHLLYEYAGDAADLVLPDVFEDRRVYAQRYLRRIFYANLPPGITDAGVMRRGLDHLDPLRETERRYAIEVALDYGDGARPAPDLAGDERFDAVATPIRPDPFSSARPGFELRTLRRCARVVVYHRLPELGPVPVAVRSTRFDYDVDPHAGLSLLARVVAVGHRREGTSEVVSATLPLRFTYSSFRPREQRFVSLRSRGAGLPATSLAARNIALIDLDGKGAPDLVESEPGGWRVWRNLGGGEFDEPRPLAGVPAGLHLADPRVALTDVDGDGLAELLVRGPDLAGFFAHGREGPFSRFVRLPAASPFDPANPAVRMLDLTGDGRADALLLGDQLLYWFENRGAEGFAAAAVVIRLHDLDEFPDVTFEDPSGRVLLADMNGDGLVDIVLAHQGCVDYWPNLGYGRFGRRVTMARLIDPPGLRTDFDPRRVMLADVNGSGGADFLYVDFDRVHIWFNRSGNAWSAPVTIDGTPQTVRPDAVRAADVFGTGTATLLWSYELGTFPGPNYKAIDLCGGVKPFLLTAMDNGLGATTRVEYATSTQFAFADARAGTPWATRLPYPVQVVARTESIDAIGQTRLVSSYTFHHGFFDSVEREFRGFARVERCDTEDFASFARPLGASGTRPDNAQAALHSPPAVTVTWHHTGAAFEAGATLASRLAAEFYRGDPQAPVLAPDDIETVDAPGEAVRAMKGAVLRSEIYARDGSPRAAHPYMVEIHAYQVRALQAKDDRAAAVFLRATRESLAMHYERDPSDPRLAHLLNLRVDDFGNVTRHLALGYQRRGSPAEPEHRRAFAVLTATRYINTPETLASDATQHRVGVACESRRYEIAHVDTLLPAAGLARPAAFDPFVVNLEDFVAPETAPTAPVKRLLSWSRSYFTADADVAGLVAPDRFDGRLALGEIDPLGVPFETYRAVLSPGLRAQIYGGLVSAADLRAGGYLDSQALDGALPSVAAGMFWAGDGRQATNPALFHLPARAQDPYGNKVTFGHDRYALALVRTEDALANVIRAKVDYRRLQPFHVTDPNGNVSSVAFDALGRIVATAVTGKGGEGDELAGFRLELTDGELDTFFADPPAQARGLLGRAGTRLVYDLRPPVRVATIAREVHAGEPGGDVSPLQIAIGYSDGRARIAQHRMLTDPGDVDGVAVTTRWIASGWTIFDNKGRAVQKFEPFFSSTPDFEFAVTRGVTSTVFYDPLGRPVAILRPDGAYEKTIIGAWEEVFWDASDTVALRPQDDPDIAGLVRDFVLAQPAFATWLERRLPDPAHPPPSAQRTPEQDAAIAALAYAATPTRRLADTLGSTFLLFQDAGGGKVLATRSVLDAEGRELRIVDARGLVAFERVFDMTGRKIRIDSIDAGRRTLLPASDDKSVLAQDANGNITRTQYDALRRPVDVRVARGGGSEAVVLRHVYGEALGAASATTNHRTRVLKVFDGAGVVTNVAYDFRGNPVEAVRRFVPSSGRIPDWNVDPEPTGSRSFTHRVRFDAVNRPVQETAPDGTVTRRRYKPSGQLAALDVVRGGTPLPLIAAIEHNARGQRTRMVYGSGVVVERDYDPEMFRLVSVGAARSGTILQDLEYTYDPVGNVTRCADNAFSTVFNANQRVDPVSRYIYDPLYRLREATGREHEALSACAHVQDWSSASPCSAPTKNTPFIALTPQPINNGRALHNWHELYSYDDAGNLTEVRHVAGPRASWTRSQVFAGTSNRLATSEAGCPGELGFVVPHDHNGNITALPHLPAIDWDHANRLVGANLDAGTAPDRVTYAYDSSGIRARKTTERSGASSCTRFYVGSYDLFTDDRPGADPAERETLSVNDGEDRLAVLETWTEAGRLERRVRVQVVNHLGSAVLELDEGGSAISYEEYHPYGSTAYLAGLSFSEVQRKRYRYSGKERDDETGLYYCAARYYAPWLGRWISCDPVAPNRELNLYAYANNSPVRFIDPTGQEILEPDATGRQVEGFGKESIPNPQPEQGRLTFRTRFFQLPGYKGAGNYYSQFNVDTGTFLGAGSKPAISSTGALHDIGLSTSVRGAHFVQYEVGGYAKGYAPLRNWSLEIFHPTTVGNLRAGMPFEQTFIYGHLRSAAGQVGLGMGSYRLTYVPQSAYPGALPQGGIIRASGTFFKAWETPAGVSRGFGMPPPVGTTFGRFLLRSGPFIVLAAFANTPVSYGPGGREISPGDVLFDPHASERLTQETDYFLELAKYKAGERATEPIPPWTPPGQENALVPLGHAVGDAFQYWGKYGLSGFEKFGEMAGDID